MQPDSILLYCRPGFEKECAAEIIHRAGELGVGGYCRTQPETAFVVFHPLDADPGPVCQRIAHDDLVFARQLMPARRFEQLPEKDRLGPLVAALGDTPVSGFLIEGADTNQGKSLAPLLRKLTAPLRQLLETRGLLEPEDGAHPRLHLFLVDTATAFLGLADPVRSAPWPMGVQRLRMPPGAPSRSTLKLEEAFLRFLTAEERDRRLASGLEAVDLGAAPGGWTWQFVRRSIRVTAVDNGPMDRRLMDSGLVTHARADGFSFRPRRPVDWMVCDMVEQPSRVAGLVAQWAARGDCRESIFNLKLPMKKRWEEILQSRARIEETLGGTEFVLRFKQLYHDREEVTGHLRLIGSRPPRP